MFEIWKMILNPGIDVLQSHTLLLSAVDSELDHGHVGVGRSFGYWILPWRGGGSSRSRSSSIVVFRLRQKEWYRSAHRFDKMSHETSLDLPGFDIQISKGRTWVKRWWCLVLASRLVHIDDFFIRSFSTWSAVLSYLPWFFPAEASGSLSPYLASQKRDLAHWNSSSPATGC